MSRENVRGFFNSKEDRYIPKRKRKHRMRHKRNTTGVFLYLIEETPTNKDSFVKIGISRNVEQRRMELQTGNARKLMVAKSYGPMARCDAEKLEVFAHIELSDIRAQGEWFERSAVEMFWTIVKKFGLDIPVNCCAA